MEEILVHPVFLAGVGLLNLAAFAAYGWDKRCASRGARRVPEARLLFLAWLGGWVGAWAGMAFFRHKTRKTSFRLQAALATLLSPLTLAVIALL